MVSKIASTRNINLDVCRAFAIIGVVALHVVGAVETLELSQANRLLVHILLAITYCSVNVFGLLSGYLKIDRPTHSASLIGIIVQAFFWCVLISLVCYLFFDQQELGTIIYNLFPFLGGRLWYITCYCFVFVLGPYVNKFVNSINQKSYCVFLITLGILMSIIPTLLLKDIFHVVNDGYSAAWLMYMYLIGGYIRKYGFGMINRVRAICGLLILITMTVCSKYLISIVLIKFGATADRRSFLLYHYCSPLTLLISVFFLHLFLSANYERKMLNAVFGWIAKVSLGVYIIHACPYSLDHVLSGDNLKIFVSENPIITAANIIFITLIITFATGILEQTRIVLFSVLWIDRMISNVGKRIDLLLEMRTS